LVLPQAVSGVGVSKSTVQRILAQAKLQPHQLERYMASSDPEFEAKAAELHGFEYYRHGTLSLYAALNVKTGRVEGKTAPRHSSAEFVAFLTDLLAKAKWAREVHIVLDNLSAHKTQAVEQFLADHPKVRLPFTATYSSWLNQVQIWFAKIERDVIARGVFTSVSDLCRKLIRYIRAYAKCVRPIRWTYTDPKTANRRQSESLGRPTSGAD
jgi:transposase